MGNLRQVNGRRTAQRRIASPDELLASKVGRQDDYGFLLHPNPGLQKQVVTKKAKLVRADLPSDEAI